MIIAGLETSTMTAAARLYFEGQLASPEMAERMERYVEAIRAAARRSRSMGRTELQVRGEILATISTTPVDPGCNIHDFSVPAASAVLDHFFARPILRIVG